MCSAWSNAPVSDPLHLQEGLDLWTVSAAGEAAHVPDVVDLIMMLTGSVCLLWGKKV